MKFLLLFLLTQHIYAFTYQKTSNGSNVRWSSRSQDIYFYVDGTNSSGISSATIDSLVQASFNQWNNTSGVTFYGVYGSSGSLENRNDILFTNNDLLFSGSSVLAVTRNVFNDETGTNLESDIYIKDSVTFSSDSTSQQYIGNVLSHEIGHALGLDHSNNLYSTMFYQLVRGQMTLDSDDQLGKASLYQASIKSGTIRGTIAGGEGEISVFGATVKVVSGRQGRVIASVLSEEDGSFIFSNLDLDDVYYIYVEPTKLLENISTHYSQVKADFCSGFAQYEGAFYETCDGSRRGKPQGIRLSSTTSTVNVGTITIRCGFDVPLQYYMAKESSGMELNDLTSTPGESMVGFFTKEDIDSAREDEIHFDLSGYSFSDNDVYLEAKVVFHDLYSQVTFEAEVTGPGGITVLNSTIDSDGNPKLNLSGQFALDTSTPSNNNFSFKIKPKTTTDYLISSSFTSLSELFPAYANLSSDKVFYQLIIHLVKKTSSGDVLYAHYPYLNNRDNSSCMDGPKTYSVKSTSSLSGSQTSTSRKVASEGDVTEVLACGSVSLINDNDSSGGPPRIYLLLQLLFAFAATVSFRVMGNALK